MPIKNRPKNRLFKSILAIATISLTPPVFAAAPDAVDDSFGAGFGQVASGLLSVNYSLASPASSGAAVVNADGSFTYTPNAGFSGTDSFTYEINDGAGGSDIATVAINIASGSDFIQAASPVLISPEDTPVPLGLTVAPDLFNGGALQDIIGTEALFRADNQGSTPTIATIPATATSISVTGYSTQSKDTSGNNNTDDDYQLLNARIDLSAGVSNGRLAHLVDGKLLGRRC